MNVQRLVGAFLTVVFALVISARPALAADKEDVIAAVHQFADNLDKDHLETALKACDSRVSILDEFPPHLWNGPTACADWFKAWGAFNERNGITDPDAKLGAAWSVDVSKDRAYAVFPATYTYTQHGKQVKELHAVLTVALRRTLAGWRIAAWAWSKH